MKKSLFVALLFLIVECAFGQSNEQKGDELYALGNYSKAIEAYKTLDDIAKVHHKIAKAYFALGNYDEALSNYKKAIESNPEDTLLKYEYAKLLSKTKKYKEANLLFRKLVHLDSLNPNFHYELGIVLEKQKDTTSIDVFLKTFSLDDTHQKAIFKIAKHHLIKRKFEKAHHFIDKGLESYDTNVELISLKAQAYYYQDYYTHSIIWFNKLLDFGEKSEFIHEKLSLSYAQNSDYVDAIYHRKQALKYNPNDANAIYVIGTYYERLQNFEKAEAYISKALKLKDVPLSIEYQRLAFVLNRQKKYEQALKAYQIAQKEDPNDIMLEFYIIRTKDEYYEDIDTKIKLYEDFLKKKAKSPFKSFAEVRLKELKQEKFLEQD